MHHATHPVFALYHTRTAMAITVSELHMVLSSQPWSKKENVELKDSVSRAAGVKNGQVAPPFTKCETLSYFCFIAAAPRVD